MAILYLLLLSAAVQRLVLMVGPRSFVMMTLRVGRPLFFYFRFFSFAEMCKYHGILKLRIHTVQVLAFVKVDAGD